MATDVETLTRDGVALWRMTSEQYAALPECEQRLELLDGVVVMAAKPRLDHQGCLAGLIEVIRPWVRQQQLGWLYPDIEVRLSADWSPSPDLVFLSRDHAARWQGTHIAGPVDLAVEILSPSNTATDRIDKFEAYARLGIPWYWIIDLEAQVIEEYHAENGVYIHRWDHGINESFSPRLFPGLTIHLSDLL
jgi:Uma2 family endonuclease